jgi:hypothetical protein
MKSICLCVAALFLGSAAHAQALTSHAAAAAGAAIGTAGGKVLSNVLDGALNKAASTGADPAVKPKPKPIETKTAAAPSPAPTPEPVSTTTVSKHARAPRTAPLFPNSEDRLVETAPTPVEAPPAPPPPPSPEDFAKLKEGSARQDVLAALGTPASHITIPDEGHLLETMTYYDGNRQIGTVRLDNGLVVSVTALPR